MINRFSKRQASIKFFRVILDENISRKEHIKAVESKLSKNIDLLCGAKKLLDNKSLKIIYFSHIHSYLNHLTIIVHV